MFTTFVAPGAAHHLGPVLSFVIPTPNGGGIFLRITAGQIHSGGVCRQQQTSQITEIRASWNSQSY
jgi:hypothetical protein